MSLIIGGRRVEVSGLESVDFVQDNRFKLGKRSYKNRPEGVWIRGIVLHTRMGLEAKNILTKGADRNWDEVVAKRWSRSGRMAGAHIAIDADGSYSCMCDLKLHSAYHAGHVNDFTIGIELYQSGDGTLFLPTIESAVQIVDVLTREFGIQRQVPMKRSPISRLMRGGKKPWKKSRKLSWHPQGQWGKDFCGVYGHRNVTFNRGPGDPGDEIFIELARVGYEMFDVEAEEDMRRWRDRQFNVGVVPDGIPGVMTREGLQDAGFLYGQYIYRPCDAEAV